MLGFLKSTYQKVKDALRKTRSLFAARLKGLFQKPIDASTFEELEQILYEADLGAQCTSRFVAHTQAFLKTNPAATQEEIIEELYQETLRILKTHSLPERQEKPLVILIVGVNGSGKTTSIAKLAHYFKKEGKKVLLAAADTFRAAAIEQLSTWAERLHVDIVKGKNGSDPAAIVYDALNAALARNVDVVIIDTAGRLQNKTDLMQELEKVKRICSKVIPSSPHETLLVLDATTGQNAIDQAKIFNQFTPLSGIILAKLDGSAKGGIVLAIYNELGIPVRWVGVGEKIEDLMPFNAHDYAKALFET